MTLMCKTILDRGTTAPSSVSGLSTIPFSRGERSSLVRVADQRVGPSDLPGRQGCEQLIASIQLVNSSTDFLDSPKRRDELLGASFLPES